MKSVLAIALLSALALSACNKPAAQPEADKTDVSAIAKLGGMTQDTAGTASATADTGSFTAAGTSTTPAQSAGATAENKSAR